MHSKETIKFVKRVISEDANKNLVKYLTFELDEICYGNSFCQCCPRVTSKIFDILALLIFFAVTVIIGGNGNGNKMGLWVFYCFFHQVVSPFLLFSFRCRAFLLCCYVFQRGHIFQALQDFCALNSAICFYIVPFFPCFCLCGHNESNWVIC